MQTKPPTVTSAELAAELVQFLGGVMKNAQSEVFRLVGDLDLTMTQLKMLHILDGVDHEPTPSELAEIVGLSPAAAGRAVDAMTRSGLVSRREDDADRRVKRLALTADGRTAVDRIHAARLQGVSRVVETLDPAQRGALSAALAPLLNALPGTPDSCAAVVPRTEDNA
jgi:DNA-binding MarR family transcriptional regulator